MFGYIGKDVLPKYGRFLVKHPVYYLKEFEFLKKPV